MARVGAFYEIKGTFEFERELAGLAADVRIRAERASEETARAIARRARAGAPRDRGDLQANITFEGKGLSWRVGIADVSLPSRGGQNSAHQNPWVYGVWYEYGFVTRNIRTTPYMRPAAEAEDAPHQARISAAVDGAVREAA